MICLSSCIKYNAPKHFEVLRGKTSIWVSVLYRAGILISHHSFSSMRTAGIHAVTKPSKIWSIGTNLPVFFLSRVSRELPQSIAHSHHIAAQRISGTIPSAALPVMPSTMPNTTAFTATKTLNTAKGLPSRPKMLFIATHRYVKQNSSPVPAA